MMESLGMSLGESQEEFLRKIERREDISCSSVGVHGLVMEFLL
jgi:hypothetical protein